MEMAVDKRRRDQASGSVNLTERFACNPGSDFNDFTQLTGNILRNGLADKVGLANDQFKHDILL
jgi:hypothetical protein